MSDLVVELRKLAQWPEDYGPASINDIAERAAAALEAAREDAWRLDWLAGDAVLTSGWREHGTWETPALLVNSTRETCTPRDFRAAIDQARGKGGGEVEGG